MIIHIVIGMDDLVWILIVIPLTFVCGRVLLYLINCSIETQYSGTDVKWWINLELDINGKSVVVISIFKVRNVCPLVLHMYWKHTLSPISVISPAVKISRSVFRQQPSMTLSYFLSLSVCPYKMLSLTVKFCIHASWETYATEPWNSMFVIWCQRCYKFRA